MESDIAKEGKEYTNITVTIMECIRVNVVENNLHSSDLVLKYGM